MSAGKRAAGTPAAAPKSSSDPVAIEEPRSGRDVDAILQRLHETRNFDFRNYKRATLLRRIGRRMTERRCRTARDYLALLERDPAEWDALVSAMLIKVTSFFRDA